jgi:hypothetical protein
MRNGQWQRRLLGNRLNIRWVSGFIFNSSAIAVLVVMRSFSLGVDVAVWCLSIASELVMCLSERDSDTLSVLAWSLSCYSCVLGWLGSTFSYFDIAMWTFHVFVAERFWHVIDVVWRLSCYCCVLFGWSTRFADFVSRHCNLNFSCVCRWEILTDYGC